MPAPRIFISSTCFDLEEVRVNLRKFIEDFGYEPVMSEFGDIFYEFNSHVQDSCIQSIKNSDVYILIIGDYYGSKYHSAQNTQKEVPESVTLMEFKNAIKEAKLKYIFINKFVEYDYNNYRTYLEKKYNEFFKKNDIENPENEKIKIKKEVDAIYPFPKDSYKYIFAFLDEIKELKIGNAYYKFENSVDIKDNLKKQWAFFMQESIRKYCEDINEKDEKDELKDISKKLHQVYETISSLAKSEDTGDKLSIESLLKIVEINNLTEIQERLSEILNSIFIDSDIYSPIPYTIELSELPNVDEIKSWLDSLKDILKSFKWSEKIKLKDLFKEANFKFANIMDNESVPYKNILELYKFYEGSKTDEEAFINRIIDILEPTVIVYSHASTFDDDEFPF